MKKTKTTLKTDIIKVALVFGFPTFLLTKNPREGNWVRFRCSNSALEINYFGGDNDIIATFTTNTKYQVPSID